MWADLLLEEFRTRENSKKNFFSRDFFVIFFEILARGLSCQESKIAKINVTTVFVACFQR